MLLLVEVPSTCVLLVEVPSTCVCVVGRGA